MTETKKNKLSEPIPVDTKKLIDGLGTIFGGVIQLLNSMEPGMAQQLADMAINGTPKEQPSETINPDDFEEILSADDLPWKDAPKESPKSEPKQTVTADDITKIIVRKIKQDRSNSDKIGMILKTYGAAKVSELPPDKYEAFLTDVSQL